MIFKKLLKKLVNAFFPARCPYCDEIIFRGEDSCSNCKSKLEYKNIVTTLCKSRNISPFQYSGINKEAVLSFKFNNNPNYSEQLAISIREAIYNEYSDYLSTENCFDIITCVPCTKKRYYERGYNQSQLLAKELSEYFNIEFQPVLIKMKETEAQHTLPKDKRKTNVQNVFDVDKSYNLEDKNILLIDDILTTGSTITECANTLYANGAKVVLCATYATTLAKT